MQVSAMAIETYENDPFQAKGRCEKASWVQL